MKNKFLKYFTIVFCFVCTNTFAEDLSINASEVRLDKINKIIFAKGNVEILDAENNLMKGEIAEYNKLSQLLKAIGETEITTSGGYRVFGTDIFYNKKNTISKNDVDFDVIMSIPYLNLASPYSVPHSYSTVLP